MSIEEKQEPIRLESEAIFDSDLERPDPEFLSEMDSFLSDPMKPLIRILTQSLEAIKPPRAMVYDPPAQDHKVRIFRLNDQANLTEIESQIESILNDGWCYHHPTVINDFLIMDFSRRKEIEENEQRNKAGEAHAIQSSN